MFLRWTAFVIDQSEHGGIEDAENLSATAEFGRRGVEDVTREDMGSQQADVERIRKARQEVRSRWEQSGYDLARNGRDGMAAC